MVIFAMVSDMLKLARLFILTLFIFCNYSYADIRVEVGDDAEAFEEVFVDDVNLSQEEKNALKGYHQRIKEHHNKYVGPGDYEEIHLSRRGSGSLESAIKFKHPDGGDFIYQFVVRKTKKHFSGYKMSRGPKVFGAYKETVALNDAKDKHDFVESKGKLFKEMNDQVFSDRLHGLNGTNFEKLSDSDLKKEFNSMFRKMHADKLNLNKHGEKLRDDEHLKAMQHDMSSITEALRDRTKKGEEKRDEINDRYKQFRARFNTFYNKQFSNWSQEYQDAKEHMKRTPKLSEKHPGKFKSRGANSKGFERDVVAPTMEKRNQSTDYGHYQTPRHEPPKRPFPDSQYDGRQKPKEEKTYWQSFWDWATPGADQKVKVEVPPRGGTKTDGRPKQGSNFASSGKAVPPTPPKGTAGNPWTQEEWREHKKQKAKEERSKKKRAEKKQKSAEDSKKPTPRSKKKDDLINKSWRQDSFLNRSHKRGSGWVSDDTEDAVDDANDALINH